MPAAQPTPAAPSTEALEEALVFCESSAADAHEPVYCRTWSRAREQLEAALLALYGLDADHHHALIVPSGLSAIAAVMASVAASHPHEDWVLVHGDELYCDVPCTVQYLVEAHAPHVARVAVDVRDREALLGLFAARGPSIRLFHFEACTNPSGQLFDFRLLERLRGHAPDCRFVCDNTWLSAALFDPFRRGVDVVVESLTKYVSGGRCIGGAVLGPNGCIAPVLSWIKALGLFVGADHCEIFLQGLAAMRPRVAAASRAAEAVAKHLEGHPAVDRVMYPMLPSHPTHALATRYLTAGGPGCLWFHTRAPLEAVHGALAADRGLRGPDCRTSFGGRTARLDPWPVAGAADACDWPRPAPREGAGGTWVRLALGHAQAPQDVCAAMDAFLADVCRDNSGGP